MSLLANFADHIKVLAPWSGTSAEFIQAMKQQIGEDRLQRSPKMACRFLKSKSVQKLLAERGVTLTVADNCIDVRRIMP